MRFNVFLLFGEKAPKRKRASTLAPSVNEMWRILKPGGIFFARLASIIGMEDQVKLIERRRYRLPDASDRFLVDEAMLKRVTAVLGGEFIEPIKTTVVENICAMTTWVVKKR
jgi:tellurite methyltransferase